jgi:hypothetical protein
MTAVQITNIKVLNNPSFFLDSFQFEITFEANQQLEEDLEWRLTYVGCADSETHDQVLDSVLVGPVPVGIDRFVFEAPAPDPTKIPAADLLGVTVVLLECLYKDRIFVRVGYYVSNENPDDIQPIALGEKDGNSRTGEEYTDMMDVEELNSENDEDDGDDEGFNNGEAAKENVNQMALDQPFQQMIKKPIVDIPPAKIKRTILEDKPRVTRFPIEWDSAMGIQMSESQAPQHQM